jgi:hypothetical protein
MRSFCDFFMAQQPLRAPRPPSYRSCMITLRHTTLGRAPLDEWSARRRDLYLTTHNTHNRQTFMLPTGLEPPITTSKRPQTHALDRAATRIGILWHRGVETRWVIHRTTREGKLKSDHSSTHSLIIVCDFALAIRDTVIFTNSLSCALVTAHSSVPK